MMGFRAAAIAVLASFALAAPAFAQQAMQVAVLEGDAPGEYRALGVVSVETHQKSIFPKTPPKQQLDDALRAEAAKMGADAVIQVKYQMGNALMSKDGNHATGVAVKFTRPPTQMAAAPAAATPPVQVATAPAAPPVQLAAAPTIAPGPAPSPVPAPAVVATAPAPVVVAAAPSPPVVVASAPAAPVVASTTSAAPHAATPAMILLSDQDLAGQRYVRLGDVSAVTHQKSLFPKTPALETLKSALQAEAAKLGADAVIEVKYKMGNALMSSEGNKASGVAVRFE